MISYNQHRKKWQRGCPCNLLINIFDKVSYYLITPHGKYEVKQRKFVKEEKKSERRKNNLWSKKKICNKETGQKFHVSKKSLLAFFIYPTTIWRRIEVKENLWKKICEQKKKLWKQRSNLWKIDRVKNFIIPKKEVFWLFFLSFHFFLDEKTQCWRPRRPHTI